MNIPSTTVIKSDEEFVLVLTSKEHLVNQGMSEAAALNTLVEWQQQKSGILLDVAYEDIYGNRQENLNMTLN